MNESFAQRNTRLVLSAFFTLLLALTIVFFVSQLWDPCKDGAEFSYDSAGELYGTVLTLLQSAANLRPCPACASPTSWA